MPKVSVSIIVPCFNVAPWLARCLDSLIGQTLHNIEIICVDDKSTDNTLEILQEYAARDKRISVIALQKNAGVAFARNTGIENARGDYIGFVDPDDYVDLDFYEKLYRTAKQSGADIVKARLATVTVDGEIKYSRFPVKTKYDFCFAFTSAIYSRRMLIEKDIRFPVGLTLGEDIVFLTKSVFVCNGFTSINNTDYWYIRRDGSADSPSHVLSQDAVSSCLYFYKDLSEWALVHQSLDADTAYVFAQAFNLIRWMFNRALNVNQSTIMEMMLFIYHNSPDKSMIDKQISLKLKNALQNNNTQKIYSILSAKNTRLRLLGFIPLLKIVKYGKSQTDYMLFDIIPLARIKRTLNLTKFYFFKVLLMKVKE